MCRQLLKRLRRVVACCAALAAGMLAARADDPSAIEFFEAKIRPVLVERCYQCHSASAKSLKGGLRLDSRAAMREGGDTGAAVVPGKVDESLLILAIEQTGAMPPMPPKGKLPDSVIADFRKWVAQGAADPRESAATEGAKPLASIDWWSLKPIKRPPIPRPTGSDVGRIRTPIDAFVLAKLREKGLSLRPEADRRTLIRRLFFDLTGLPPTPEDVRAFESDSRHDAYEQLVDRLLASPRYGERWARHWMDAVHFAETHGHDQDRIRVNAWPYRDYLIGSFNGDTPYARFIQEQIAADAIFPEDPRRVVALGMLAAGPWDESSLRDIREDSIDRQIGYYLDRDDMVTTVMATFSSTTVHCARCHDHKFDPITQEDYYGLQAVFAGVDRADRPFEPDRKMSVIREWINSRRQALATSDKLAMDGLLAPAVQDEVAHWEQSLSERPAQWTVLDPVALKSDGGVTLTEEADHSIFASGKRPAEDTYWISAKTELRGITAIRLEVLPDDRLPQKGPGRADNGNLHLTEITVDAALRASESSSPTPRAIRFAAADFDQEGWGVSSAIDGNTRTAWGIFPKVGARHEAVFELAEVLACDAGVSLTIGLKQTYPTGHLIGRFRLSITTAARPVRPSSYPDSIAAILARPAASRSPEERRELAMFVVREQLERQFNSLPARPLVYAGAADFEPDAGHKPPGGPRPVFVLARGDINKPGKPAVPGSLSCVPWLPARFDSIAALDEASRRVALAKWLSDPNNPLTWRSIVNRVWHHHFGRGIVGTPNDFGRMGSPPTHAELLDWLAVEFRDTGGSLKALHRLIVTSSVFRQESASSSDGVRLDADNLWLWRQNRRRLDAESVRDALLHVSGTLDLTMGGPSDRQFALSPGVHVTPVVDYGKFDWDCAAARRRSVYRFVFRTLPDPFVDALDGSDASQLTAVRNESVTPLQSLALLNNAFVLRQAEHLAARLKLSRPELANQVADAFELVLNRPAAAAELETWTAYAGKHGIENVCRLLFNCNEFLYVN